MFSEKWVSVREKNIKLLLETVTCIATTETVMYVIHCRKCYLHDCEGDSHMHNFNFKILMIHMIFVIRRVFVCMELSSKSELIYII